MEKTKPDGDNPIPRKKNDITTKAAFVEWFTARIVPQNSTQSMVSADIKWWAVQP